MWDTLSDDAADADKLLLCCGGVVSARLELPEFQPFSILYREGTSGVMGLADLCSRLLDVSKPALDKKTSIGVLSTTSRRSRSTLVKRGFQIIKA